MVSDKAKEFILKVEEVQKKAKLEVRLAEEKQFLTQSTLDALLPPSIANQLIEADVRFLNCTPFAAHGCASLHFSVDTREQVGAVWHALTKKYPADPLRLCQGVYLNPETWVNAQPPSDLLKGPTVSPLYWHLQYAKDDTRAEARFYLQGEVANKKGDSLVQVHVRIEQDPVAVAMRQKDLYQQSPSYIQQRLREHLPDGRVQTYACGGGTETLLVFYEQSRPGVGQFLSAFAVSV